MLLGELGFTVGFRAWGRGSLCRTPASSDVMGVFMAVHAVLCLAVGGLAHFSTVCTSFCWVSSGTHKRSAWFPEGDETLAYVRQGSQLCSISMALAMLVECVGGMVTIENPVNSRLELHPDFQFFMKWMKQQREDTGKGLMRTNVLLGDFGAATKKPDPKPLTLGKI